jgi:hypothetical protein
MKGIIGKWTQKENDRVGRDDISSFVFAGLFVVLSAFILIQIVD